MNSSTDRYYEEMSARLKNAGPISNYVDLITYDDLRQRKTKPLRTSNIRWLIELKRRKNRAYYMDCPSPDRIAR